MAEAAFPDEDEVLRAVEAGRLSALIERCVGGVLVGERFAEIGRVTDLIWMGFGEEVFAPSRLDPARHMPRYGLHVQCPFGIDTDGRSTVGSRDIYADPKAPDETAREFDWEPLGANLFDRQAAALNARIQGVGVESHASRR